MNVDIGPLQDRDNIKYIRYINHLKILDKVMDKNFSLQQEVLELKQQIKEMEDEYRTILLLHT